MPRILVVEDEPGSLMALEDDLTMEGYQVEVAGDGPTGSKLAREKGFYLILLDVMLPGKDGFEVCARAASCGHQNTNPDVDRAKRRKRKK